MKRFVYAVILVLLVSAVLPAPRPAAAQAPAPELDRGTPYVPGEVVVSFADGISPRALRARATALAGSVSATVVDQFDNMALFQFDPQADVFAAAEKVSAAYDVVLAQPNYVYWIPESAEALQEPYPVEAYTLSSPDGRKVSLSWEQVAALRTRRKVGSTYRVVPTYPSEFTTGPIPGTFWGWDKAQADLIWADKKVPGYVCVLDTGVDAAHPDLSGLVLAGKDFVNNDANAADDNGHGTHVAGIISAKINSAGGTAMGVSNAKILPVKVLNAQGFGTTYNISAGILYCAKNLYTSVLNLSLGGYANDPIQYKALNTAVTTKKKLVVAAAGNESTSVKVYPAAWADPTEPAPVAGLPSIAGGLVSVGAGRSPSPYKVWVDQSNLGVVDESEIYDPTACATGRADDYGATGSNYGKWVNLVAPGEHIYATTPVSYPFYLNYYYGTPSGYAYMSGTSMAAAFVSGAAARVWTTLSTAELTNPHLSVKSRLTGSDYSSPLTFAVSSAVSDPTEGYDNPARVIGSQTVLYGQPFDHDGDDSTVEIVMAPFCWPIASAPFGAAQDMSGARYLNVAKAMKRGALVAEVKDALNGSPTSGAKVLAVMGGVTRDTSVTNGAPFVVLINLPDSGDYTLKVNKTGSTTGAQVFNSGITIQPGSSYFDVYSTVGLPPNVNMHAVLDWLNPIAGPEEGQDVEVDLDLYLVLPNGANPAGTTIVGTEAAWDEDTAKSELYSFIDDAFFGAGTLLKPNQFGGSWSPFAIHNFDGVTYTSDPMREMGTPTESVSITFRSALTVSPWYLPKYTGNYKFLVTDYSTYTGYGYLDKFKLDGTDPNKFYVAPVLRYWSAGRILATVKMNNTCDGSKAWWKPLVVSGDTGKPDDGVNTCTNTPLN